MPLLFGAVMFALAHTQAPLYWSNQNQYFLHGLAAGGLGKLHDDWLANTADPTPVFSAGVAGTFRGLGPTIFYLAYALLLAVYFLSLMALGTATPSGVRSDMGRLRLGVGLIAIHAAICRWGSVQLFGADYPWFFQSGVANQYVLGPGLQPSAFGVLLIAAIAAFAHDRLVWTALCVGGAAIVHPAYLLLAALLMLGFMHVLWWQGRRMACLAIGAGTLILVGPVIVDTVRTFAPTSSESFAAAQEILIDRRLPHHARIELWLDIIAALQIAWIVMGMLLLRRSRLWAALGIPFLLAAGLTLAQWLTSSRLLALLFPWRMSAVLVPVTTAVVLSRTITLFHPRDVEFSTGGIDWSRARAYVLALIAFALLTGSLAIQWGRWVYIVPSEERELYEFVRGNASDHDLFLVPVTAPVIAAGAGGSPSTTFVPIQQAVSQNKFPPDLQRFRLATGVPIYVDFKSIPYKDVDVLEWRRRVAQVEAWQSKSEPDQLRLAGITHVVIHAEREFDRTQFELLWSNPVYRVLKLRPVNSPAAGD